MASSEPPSSVLSSHALLMSCINAEKSAAEQVQPSGPYPVTLLLPAGVSTSFTVTAPTKKHTAALIPSESPQVSPSESPPCWSSCQPILWKAFLPTDITYDVMHVQCVEMVL